VKQVFDPSTIVIYIIGNLVSYPVYSATFLGLYIFMSCVADNHACTVVSQKSTHVFGLQLCTGTAP